MNLDSEAEFSTSKWLKQIVWHAKQDASNLRFIVQLLCNSDVLFLFDRQIQVFIFYTSVKIIFISYKRAAQQDTVEWEQP